jgi:hypothetical protein
MAKIVEEVLIVKFSKIVKDSEESGDLVSPDITSALEQVAQELVGDAMLVEVTRVDQ